MDFSAAEMIERIKSKVPLKNLEPLGIPSGTISAWKTNNRPPRSDDLFKIADYLNVTMEWLLTGEAKDRFNPDPKIPEQEEKLLSCFRLLPDDRKEMFLTMLSAVVKN